MILELMDSRYLKRFLLLDYLHINQNHSIELMELVKLSQVSYPTVKKIITDIRMDIIDLGYSEYVELIDLPEQNKVIWNVNSSIWSDLLL
jgi:glycine/serine hydroxymethyltransferase